MSSRLTKGNLRRMLGLTGLTATEELVLDGVTPGTATASKALVLDSSKGIATITTATITTLTSTTGNITTVNATNIDAGASGTAGTVDIFPGTASKGKLTFTCTDQTGNTQVIVNAAAMGQATTFTLPDPGASTETLALLATAQTLTNKTLTGNINADTKFCTTQFDATSGTTGTTLTAVVGMSQTVVVGTYRFVIRVPGVATANSGVKYGFKLTTTVLSALEATARIYTASAVEVQHTTTATDLASLAASTTAAIYTEITGRVTVSTGGTIALYAAQNASHADTTSVYIGADMNFTRTA